MRFMHNKALHIVAFILLVVGGLNWLLYAFGVNLVEMILGSIPIAEKVVYILVGLAAVYEVLIHKATCRDCGAGGSSSAPEASTGEGGM